MKTQEQTMVARELNLRTKELMTVSRMRLIQENREKGTAMGRLNLGDKDVEMISTWIENDAITGDMYAEKLDALLELGSTADKEALEKAGLTSAGQELLNIWNDLDRGAIKQDSAFEQADQAVRKRNAGAEKDM
jgi:DNA topoisomerase VI subunit A